MPKDRQLICSFYIRKLASIYSKTNVSFLLVGTRKSSGSPTTPTPILRPTRSFSSGSTTNHHPGLKHVMIREPSLRHLPSALRNSYPGARKITTTSKTIATTTTPVVRLEVARHHLHRHSYMAERLVGGDVGPQWGTLYFR